MTEVRGFVLLSQVIERGGEAVSWVNCELTGSLGPRLAVVVSWCHRTPCRSCQAWTPRALRPFVITAEQECVSVTGNP